MPERLTAEDVACWVLKSQRAPEEIDPHWRPGTSAFLERCLRRTYRAALMRPGQPCLLWLSGQNAPGVQAIGTLTSEAQLPEAGDPERPQVSITVSLHRLEEPVSRRSLQADPVFAGAEVLRMPAGSNPSYVSADRFAALVEHLHRGDLSHSGWTHV